MCFSIHTATTVSAFSPSTRLSSISAQRQGSPGKTDEDCHILRGRGTIGCGRTSDLWMGTFCCPFSQLYGCPELGFLFLLLHLLVSTARIFAKVDCYIVDVDQQQQWQRQVVASRLYPQKRQRSSNLEGKRIKRIMPRREGRRRWSKERSFGLV